MNREILFRGRRVYNGEWVYGYYVKNEKALWKHVIFCSKNLTFFELIPETVCQFTGLTDKNGNKIFEGDTYDSEWPGSFYQIKFLNGAFCAGIEELGYEPLGFEIDRETDMIEIDSFASTIEITGNIHDNDQI